MAIRTISFDVDVGSVSPNVEQFGGTMGDHRVTRVEFVISDSLFSTLQNTYANKVFYRFDIYNGEGQIHTSNVYQITDNTVWIELEEKHTRYGGKITVYLVITVLSDDNEMQVELYSFPVKLYLKNKPNGKPCKEESYQSITGIYESTKASENLAQAYAENAQTSALKAATVLSDVKDTVNTSLEEAKSSGMFDGVSVTHYWDGTVLNVTSASGTSSADLKGEKGEEMVVDQAFNHSSKNAISNKTVSDELARFDSRIQEAANIGISVNNRLDYDYYTKSDIDDFNYADKAYVDDAVANINTGDSGTTDYSELSNKPKINGVELSGEVTTNDLGIEIPTKLSELENDKGFIDNTSLSDYYTKTDIAAFDYADKAYVDDAVANVNTGGTVDLSNYYTKTEVDNLAPSKHLIEFHNNEHVVILQTQEYLTNNSSFIEVSDFSGISFSCAKDDDGNKLSIGVGGSVINGVGDPQLITDAANRKYVDNAIANIDSTTNYNELSNKPKINGVELSGEVTTNDLGIEIPTKLSELENDKGFIDITPLSNYYTKTDIAAFDYADKAYVNEAIASANTGSSIDLNDYYTKSEINNFNYADKEYVDDAIANINVDLNDSITVDQTYDAVSTNAQSGIAVAEAISTKADAECTIIDASYFRGMRQTLMSDGTYSEFITDIDYNSNNRIAVFTLSNGLIFTSGEFVSTDEIANAGFEVNKRYVFVVENKIITSIKQMTLLSDKADKTYVDALVGDIESLLGGI